MLLSHTHKFILNSKTVGTSIEVDFITMSDEDIVTPIILKNPHIPRNFQWEDRKYSSKNKFYNHMLIEIESKVGDRIYNATSNSVWKENH